MKKDKIEIFKSASVIDTHAHVVLEETEKSAGALGPEMLFDGQTPVYRIGDYHLKGVNYKNTAFMDPKIRIEKMDVANIDLQVLTPNPLTYFHYSEKDLSINFSKKHNDSLSYHIKYAPSRLVGMANLPLQDPSASVDELHRAIEDLNLCGAAIGTSSIYQLDDPIYDSLYDVFESFEVPLFIHPAPSGIDRPIIDDSLKRYELDLMIGFSFQETIAVANLIYGGVLERHPNLNVCVSHGGGMLPFVAGRLIKACKKRPWIPERLKVDGAFESEMKKIWYDSHVHSKEALELLIKVVGDDKIVYGTNFAGWDQPDKYDTNKTISKKWYKNTLELFMIQK